MQCNKLNSIGCTSLSIYLVWEAKVNQSRERKRKPEVKSNFRDGRND